MELRHSLSTPAIGKLGVLGGLPHMGNLRCGTTLIV